MTYFPGADQFPIQTASGDSNFVATWDTLNIDPVTGQAQAHLTNISYAERSGEAGDDPSIFMGDFLDAHLHDPNNPDADGLVFTFDATALLIGSNNFTNSYDSFSAGDQTVFIISGAVIPEPTTLALLSLAGLTLARRRRTA